MRLTILGGGGFRVPLVYRALLRRPDGAARSCCTTRTRAGCGSSRRCWPRSGPGGPAVRLETDLDAALRGADFVFSAMRVGGTAGRVRDERLPLAQGVLGQETVGAGGVLYGLRTLPVAVRVAERVRAVAPRAWVINFTNPAGMVTEAMSRVLGPRVIGICDSPVGLVRRAARAAGADPDAPGFGYDYVGLNHLGWLRRLTVDGRDLLPGLLADPAALESFEEGRLFGARWLAALGSLPNEYLHYYYFQREALAAVRAAEATRGEFLDRQQSDFFAAADAAAGAGGDRRGRQRAGGGRAPARAARTRTRAPRRRTTCGSGPGWSARRRTWPRTARPPAAGSATRTTWTAAATTRWRWP